MIGQSLNQNLREAAKIWAGWPQKSVKHLWSIILAGGNGSRVSELTHRWLGRSVPKQYCAFVGTESMLQHTLHRADFLGERDHQLILIARDHQNEARPQLADRWAKGVILQPANRDTLPGIFLPLTYIYVRDSEATVAIFPSDHFIYPQDNFIHIMEQATRAAEKLSHLLIIIGVPAVTSEIDYGWICPGKEIWRPGDGAVRKVKQFLEKPSSSRAAAAMESGALWNTFIMVVKARTLWELGLTFAPTILKRFERLYQVIGTSREAAVLEDIYETMPAGNFSSDLLTPAAEHIGVIPMKNVLWSDWGREERIIETLRLIGKRPNFTMMPAVRYRRVLEPAVNLSIAK